MFIFTTKFNRKKFICAILIAALAIVGIIFLLSKMGGGGGGGGGKELANAAKNVGTNEERVAYLESYGWQVTPQPLASEELVIPENLETTYADYNKLQTDQGFNLAKYQGKKAMRYTYEIVNYPTGEKNVQANLLIYKNTVIGGDVCTTALDGWMHGLDYPTG